MEGVMMQGATSMAMTVRAENGDILTETKRLSPKKWYNKVPVLRGCVAFVKSLVGGTSALMKSAEVIYPEEETPGKASFAIAAVLGVVFAIALFILLPSFVASLIDKYLISLSVLAYALIEGVLRIFYFRALSSHCFADEGHKAHLYVPRGGTPHHQLLRARTSPYRGKRAEVFDASQPLRNHFSVFRYGGVHFGVFAGYLDSGASWVG